MGVSEISGNIGNKSLKALVLLTFFDPLAVTTSVTSGYNSGNKTAMEKIVLPMTSFLLPLCYRKKRLAVTAEPVGTAQKSKFVTAVTARKQYPCPAHNPPLQAIRMAVRATLSTEPVTAPENARARVLEDGWSRHPTEPILSAKRQIREALSVAAQRGINRFLKPN